MQHPQHLAVIEPRRHGDVARMPPGVVPHGAGEGPAAILMHRQGEDAWVIVEGVLDAIAMMGVDVEIKDARQPQAEPFEQPKHGVINEAEPARPIGPAVMGAATRHMDHAALAGQPGGEHRAAGAGGGAAEHLAIDRVAIGAEAEALALLGADRQGRLGPLQRREIRRRVEPGEVIEARNRAVAVLRLGQPAERADQVERHRHARDRQRVLGPEAGATVDLGTDQDGKHARRAGMGPPPLRRKPPSPAPINATPQPGRALTIDRSARRG
ncbi:hypothetical protein GCM10011320_00390 [Neoroseomonas lacus]|uniref:Uncharacterized protein n=1 Tax=Neoroseomonas lacus TaxID=287609 RepID=A0A917K3H1_9PROT|nr:hypothetical protein GCM10011320_00390 [Neoroseomonas lacus]